MLEPEIFQKKLLEWFTKHGRQQLPWQHPRNPYRVWLSEIMLQQTQVTTVIPYFEKFTTAFPNITLLANAPLDTVLHLWAGLGYYARARHLHQTAQKITADYQGEFPNTLEALQNLPGIGRSTAGAILSLGFNQPAPILDGNVKRILCRLHAIKGWPGSTHVLKQLWNLAVYYTPHQNVASYTQAIMDFGSLVCTRHKPRCAICPFNKDCIAYRNQETNVYPTPKKLQDLPQRTAQFLILINPQGEILLEKRPPIGIWGGLWSLPECSLDSSIQEFCANNYHCNIIKTDTQPAIMHTFSHFQLTIQPIVCYVTSSYPLNLQDNAMQGWYSYEQIQKKGLAAPIKKLLHGFQGDKLHDSKNI